MLPTIFLLECSGFCTAMSVVAWIQNSSWSSDFNLAITRYVAPPIAVVLFLVAISDFIKWLTGEPSETSVPLSWVLIGGGFLAAAVTWAIVEIRQQGSGRTTHTRRYRRT